MLSPFLCAVNRKGAGSNVLFIKVSVRVMVRVYLGSDVNFICACVGSYQFQIAKYFIHPPSRHTSSHDVSLTASVS